MKLSQVKVDELSTERITKILFCDRQDDISKGDCIFVYGGRGRERIYKAIDLYQRKRAKYILFTGGFKYGKYSYPEAASMRDNALKMGISAEAILTEEISNNTKENAIASLFVLENKLRSLNFKTEL